jgi:peptide deformylase
MSSEDTAQLERPGEPDEQASVPAEQASVPAEQASVPAEQASEPTLQASQPDQQGPDPREPASEPDELDEETRLRRDAALVRVRKLGDPVLRASAVEVERFDEQLNAEIARMGELMSDALGVGLAANQVGILHRVLVYRADPDEPVTALVNPVIEWRSDELETAEEGCLSIPDVHVEVERPARIRTRARDAAGDEIEVEAEGLEARVIQHEVDHLDGILILDRISREARRDAMRAAREAREARAAAPTAQPSTGEPGTSDPEAADPDATPV